MADPEALTELVDDDPSRDDSEEALAEWGPPGNHFGLEKPALTGSIPARGA